MANEPPSNFDFMRPELWPIWENRFKIYLNVTGLVSKLDVEKIGILCNSMGEKSEEILAQVLPDAATKSLNDVLNAFKDYFAPNKNIIFERACFNTRSQAPGETVDKFITALRTLAESCDYGHLKDQLIRDRIVMGITDTLTSERLQVLSDLTLDKAISIVREAEQQQKHTQTLKPDVVEVDRVCTENAEGQTAPPQKPVLQGDNESPAKVCRMKAINCTETNDREESDPTNHGGINQREYVLGHVNQKQNDDDYLAEDSSSSARRTNAGSARDGSTGASRNTVGNVRGRASSGTGSNRGAGSSSAAKKQAAPRTSADNFERPSSSASNTTAINNENMFPTRGSTDDNTVILCLCKERTKLQTVRKEGPNKGRMFYNCTKPRGFQCNFFLWADDSETRERPGNAQNNYTQPCPPLPAARHSTRTQGRDDPPEAGVPTCVCGQPAVSKTVRKKSPNTGKQFWACPQGQGSPCNFFQWADETNSGDGGDDDGGSGGTRGRGEGATRAPAGTTKRKCSVCQVKGHTKRTCPQNSMDQKNRPPPCGNKR